MDNEKNLDNNLENETPKKSTSKMDSIKSKMNASLKKTKQKIDESMASTKKKLDESVASTKQKISESKQKFNDKKAEASSNLAVIKKTLDAKNMKAQYESSGIKARIDKFQRFSIITSVLLTLIMAIYSVINMAKGWTDTAAKYVTIAMVAAYVVAFLILIILFKADKKNLNANMKNYKFAIKLMKKIVNLINLGLSLAVMFTALEQDNGPKKIFAFVIAVIGITFAILKVVAFIFKFIKKKKKAMKKAKERALNQAKEEKIKAYIEECKKNAEAATASEQVAVANTMNNTEIKQIVDSLDEDQVKELQEMIDSIEDIKPVQTQEAKA